MDQKGLPPIYYVQKLIGPGGFPLGPKRGSPPIYLDPTLEPRSKAPLFTEACPP